MTRKKVEYCNFLDGVYLALSCIKMAALRTFGRFSVDSKVPFY